MSKEIERRFLLAKGSSIPIPAQHTKSTLKQAYLVGEKDRQIRVRIANNTVAWLCIKFTESIIRDEFEYVIPLNEAKEIYKKCGWRIEKKRLSFKSNGYHYDIDTYKNGLVSVEVEFESKKHMKAWVKPSWLGEEITGVAKYSNILMAKYEMKFGPDKKESGSLRSITKSKSQNDGGMFPSLNDDVYGN